MFFPATFPASCRILIFHRHGIPRVSRVSAVCLSRRSVPAGLVRPAASLAGKLLRKLLGKLGDHVCTFPVNNVSIGPVLRKNFRSISQQFAAFRSNFPASQELRREPFQRPSPNTSILGWFLQEYFPALGKKFPSKGGKQSISSAGANSQVLT